MPWCPRRENAAAAELELTPEDLDRLAAIAPVGSAAGTGYQEGGMHTVNR